MLTRDGGKNVFKTTEKGLGLINAFKVFLSEMEDLILVDSHTVSLVDNAISFKKG